MASEIMEKAEQKNVQPAERTRPTRTYRPSVDIVETSDELMLCADMPGACPDSIDVNFENGMLTIHGHVKSRIPEHVNVLEREFGVGDFYRTFQVSEAIDGGRISAEFAHGVLTLHLPKVEEARPRRIKVSATD